MSYVSEPAQRGLVIYGLGASSRLIAAIDRAVTAPIAACNDSIVARVLTALTTGLAALGPAQRLRLIGWMLVVAALTAGSVGGLRDAALPSLVIGAWATALAIGMLLMAGAPQIVPLRWAAVASPPASVARSEPRELTARLGAIGAALAAALGVAFAASPLFVLFAAATALLFRRAAKGLDGRERRWILAMLLAALAVRLLLLLALFTFGDTVHQQFPDFVGDGGYMKQRSVWLRNLWIGRPIGSEYLYALSGDYGWTSFYYLLACVQTVFGASPYGVHVLNIWLFLAAAVVLHRIARAAYGPVASGIALAVIAFLPSWLIWSTAVLKEPLIFLLLMMTFVAALAALRRPTRLQRGAAGALLALAAAAAWTVRPAALVIVAGGVTAILLGRLLARPRRIVATLIVATLLIAAAAGADRLMRTHPVQRLVWDTVTHAALLHVGNVSSSGHSYLLLNQTFYRDVNNSRTFVHQELTAAEAVRFVVRSLAAFVIMPGPWDAVSPMEVAFVPQQMLWYVLLVLAAVGLVSSAAGRGCAATEFAIGCVAAGAVIVTLTNGNIGTYLRLRDMVTPFVAVLSGAGATALLRGAARPSRAAAVTTLT